LAVSGLPALMMTGYADTNLIGSRPLDVALLSKPFANETLLRAVEQSLRV